MAETRESANSGARPFPAAESSGHRADHRSLPLEGSASFEQQELALSAYRQMYHRDDSDFVPVEAQLQNDFTRLCAILQDLWSQIEEASDRLLTNTDYLAFRAAGTASSSVGSVLNPLAPSGTF